jgi:hypothetical protein
LAAGKPCMPHLWLLMLFALLGLLATCAIM